MTRDDIIKFVEWLNTQTDLILDPVCDLDPEAVVDRYIEQTEKI